MKRTFIPYESNDPNDWGFFIKTDPDVLYSDSTPQNVEWPQMEDPDNWGVSLKSVAHPKGSWFKSLWLRLFGTRLSKKALETVEIV